MYGAETKRIMSINTPDTFVGKIVGGKKLNNASLALASAAYSFSKSGGYGEKFVDMVKTLGFGRTSLFGAVAFLKKHDFIKRNDRGGFEIVDMENVGAGYDEKDFALRDTTFLFVSDGKSIERKLSATEFNILSRIRRHNFNERTNNFKGSYSSMVKTMGYSEPTIRKAISALIGSGLIYITETKRIAHYKELTIKVSEKLIRKKKKEEKAGEKRQEKSRAGYVSVDVANADMRAERERYYARIKEKSEREAEKKNAEALKHPRFAEIERELRSIEIEIAKAEYFAPEKSGELLARKTALLKERSRLLIKMRIDEKTLIAQCFCVKCSDTGFLPDGRACDCFGTYFQT